MTPMIVVANKRLILVWNVIASATSSVAIGGRGPGILYLFLNGAMLDLDCFELLRISETN